MHDHGKEAWTAGNHYEPYIGRWSRLVAREFLAWLNPDAGLDWLDVGCGTGALTQTILEQARPRSVAGVDLSLAYVEHVGALITDQRAGFQAADARALPFKQASFGYAVSGLVLNFVPDPAAAVREMRRVVLPGGVAAAYVWDYAGKMEMIRFFWDAAVALDPAAVDLDEGKRFPLCRPEPLANLFADTGLRKVEVTAIDVSTVFRNFDDYWGPFLGGQGPAPVYAASLSDERRSALREHLHERLPAADDGSIPLVARAWSVRGLAAG